VLTAIMAVAVVITILVLPVGVMAVTVVDPEIVPETARVPAAVNKAAGKLMVKVLQEADGLTVPVLNATVKTLAVAGGIVVPVNGTVNTTSEI